MSQLTEASARAVTEHAGEQGRTARAGRGQPGMPGGDRAVSSSSVAPASDRPAGRTEALAEALAFQRRILPQVSRTFALTIPELPAGLDQAIANAYLLCRIADTIEDEPALSPASKSDFQDRLVAAIAGREPAGGLSRALAAGLSGHTLPAEVELAAGLDQVLRCTQSLAPVQQEAMRRCLAIMCRGMSEFQRNAGPDGLPGQGDLDQYCYYVAGVVGEMLTELFANHDPAIAARRPALLRLAGSFGQALQMTNILKDVWEDRARGVCWWPRDLFAAEGVDLARLDQARGTPGFSRALGRLIGVAHGHLRNALDYTLLIPRRQAGIRRFCLWAIGLAVLTLRNIQQRPDFASGAEVKLARKRVGQVVAATALGLRSNLALRALFGWAARGLPLTAVDGQALPSAWAEHEALSLHEPAAP